MSGFSNERADVYRAAFLESGQQSLADLERALAAVGDSLEAHHRILEFGCGCGRIMRWMEGLGRTRVLVGTDIDARAIEWAASNLPFARFDVNDGLPPTRYEDGEFDLVVNHSVFTHLDERYQDLWLAELRRIASPSGIVVLSVHGAYAFQSSEEQLEAGSRERCEWRVSLERQGILYISDDTYVGSAFPDFYHTAFHAPWYVFEHWSRWFDVLAYLPQSGLGFQDQVVLCRRPDSRECVAPIRACQRDGASSSAAWHATVSGSEFGGVLDMPTDASRFGSLGLLGRRAIFRLARPVLSAQEKVDRSLGEAISLLNARLDERLPPVVGVALREQAERIQRLEDEIQELRGKPTGDSRSPS